MYMSANSEDKNKELPSSPFDVSENSNSGQAAGSAGGGAVGIGMLVAMPFIFMLWFVVGSWQLSLLLDQVKCHKGQLGCLLPVNPNNFPYKDPAVKTKKSGAAILEAIGIATVDSGELFIGKLFGVTPKKQTGGDRRKSRKLYKQRGGGAQSVNNLLTSIDVNGYRPFDIFNGPVQFPYSMAYEKAPWYEPSFLNFGKWFAHMQITAWSTARMVLSSYLGTIGALMKTKNDDLNDGVRLALTIAMPLIIGLALFAAPLVSFVSCIWGMFKGGWNYLFAIIFFFFPALTILTTALQHFSLIAYFLIGGLGAVGGSGAEQWATNKSIIGSLLINKWIQFIIFIGLVVVLIIALTFKARQDGLLGTKESFQTKQSLRKSFNSNFSSQGKAS